MADLQIAVCVTNVEKFKNEEAIGTGESAVGGVKHQNKPIDTGMHICPEYSTLHLFQAKKLTRNSMSIRIWFLLL